MTFIHDRLFIGTADDCRAGSEDLAVVHACKSPCHQRAVGYRRSLAPSHPCYLFLELEHDLYLNLVDPPLPLFKVTSFTRFLAFARPKHDAGAALLMHCNRGESRSPSLALLFLAKHLRALPNSSYAEARRAFERIFPAYRPGQGIERFLVDHWSAIE